MSRTFFCGRKFWLRNAAAPNYHQDFKFKYMRTVGFGHLRVGLAAALGGAALFLSRSRLSVKFKQETGQNLIDFILKEKTDEAKRLLRYTDKPAAAISAYLGFSSQSHFSRVFKKYAGCQPNEYRKRFGG